MTPLPFLATSLALVAEGGADEVRLRKSAGSRPSLSLVSLTTETGASVKFLILGLFFVDPFGVIGRCDEPFLLALLVSRGILNMDPLSAFGSSLGLEKEITGSFKFH